MFSSLQYNVLLLLIRVSRHAHNAGCGKSRAQNYAKHLYFANVALNSVRENFAGVMSAVNQDDDDIISLSEEMVNSRAPASAALRHPGSVMYSLGLSAEGKREKYPSDDTYHRQLTAPKSRGMSRYMAGRRERTGTTMPVRPSVAPSPRRNGAFGLPRAWPKAGWRYCVRVCG